MKIKLLEYFKYLRDVSHKIAVKADWKKCLNQKPNKRLEAVYQLSKKEIENEFLLKSNKKTLKSLQKYMKGFSEKEIFLGLVSIYGISKNVGSIFNIPVKFNVNEDNGEIEDITFDYNNISINYQLLLTIVPQTDDNQFFKIDSATDLIKSFFINEESKNNPFKDINNLIHSLKEIFKNFIKENEIIIQEESTTLEKKKETINSCKIDYENTYLFAFQVPNSISTWKYLNDFCKEIEEYDSIDSKVLNSLLSNEPLNEEDYIFDSKIFEDIPLEISNAQKKSIEKAFTEKISYIQGPPGTGKSHTITAMALIAMYMHKKVLIVSQKNTALQVVKNKIEGHLKDVSNDIINYIYFEKNSKKILKNKLEKFIFNYKDLKSEEILNLEKKYEKYVEENKQIKIKIKNIENELNIELNKQSLFYELNNNYVRHKINYLNGLSIINSKDLLNIEPVELENKNDRFLQIIKTIKSEYESKKISKFNLKKLNILNKEFNRKFNSNIDFKELLKKQILFEYIENIFSLANQLNKLNYAQRHLAHKTKIDYNTINKNNDILINQKLKKEIFNKKIELNVLKSFNSYNKNKIKNIDEFENLAKMLHFQKSDIIVDKLKNINFTNILSVFPLWLCEIRNIGEILPNNKEMFDLIIVDEASQVNITEIFPVFYRGKNICVVGDDMQLGLDSVGLNFLLKKDQEQQIWDKYLGFELSYQEAEKYNYTVTKSSILDLITSKISNKSYPKTMLDEHYRSMPILAKYTNGFYSNGLKIMSETPEKSLVNCFQSIKVNGTKDGKINKIEAQEVINIIKYIHKIKSNKKYIDNGFKSDNSIGIVSLLRDQVEYIKFLISEDSELNMIEEEDYFLVKNCRIKCGTPEELQGDEFDYVIFSATVDEDSRNNKHNTNLNRFNVATSRARYFTYFVYSDVFRIDLFRKYLKNFGIEETTSISFSELVGWSFSEPDIDSEFERYVGEYLKDIILKNEPLNWKIFNQVPFAGKKIDYVIFNEQNQKHIAIEVDGQFHFKDNMGRVYSVEHNERMDLLTRAGWKIINTPYFLWYYNGKIDENNIHLIQEKQRIEKEIINYLK